jgi:hypothetical protein
MTDLWDALYEKPSVLTPDWGTHRIFSPFAYKHIRNLYQAPIVHSEVLHLARTLPTCWLATDEGPVLVALRSLIGEPAAIPKAARALATLPLALQAYPVVVPSGSTADGRIQVDRALADEPTDIGAPLMMGDGRPSRAMALRARAALRAGRSLAATRDLTQRLAEAGLLEPWPLQFDLGQGETVRREEFLVLARDRLDDPVLYAAIAAHGIEAGLFIAAHRLSLFRVPSLVSAARAAAAARSKGEPAAREVA